jgi:hypothetical protein
MLPMRGEMVLPQDKQRDFQGLVLRPGYGSRGSAPPLLNAAAAASGV